MNYIIPVNDARIIKRMKKIKEEPSNANPFRVQIQNFSSKNNHNKKNKT